MRLFIGAYIALIVFAIWVAVSGQELDTAMKSWPLNRDVYVIDTAGVCLYVFHPLGYKGGIAAVPKTQLPRGIGCQ